MLSQNTLREILRDQRPPIVQGKQVPREIISSLPMPSSFALVLTGARRAGKSVLQSQLITAGGPFMYCNLEDTRLYRFSPTDFPTFLTLVDELAPDGARIYLDEVQEVREWQRLVRTLLDRGRRVCLTGSNASLLGRELGSKLTGRHLSFEVFPFSYREYLQYRQQLPGRDSLLTFLDDGGFPGFLRDRDPLALQELLRDIVQRDITTRRRLRQNHHMMNLVLFLLANTGRPFSLQQLTKSLDIPAVAQTRRYLDYAQDAYLLFPVQKFSPSFRRRVVSPAKYYAIDNGLRRVNSPQMTQDTGHRLENAIFLELYKTRQRVHYAGEKDRWECDFLTDTDAIQVCLQLTPQNMGREIRGALAGAALPGNPRRPLILTLDQRDTIRENGEVVEVWPAWQWLTGSVPAIAPVHRPTAAG